MLSPSPLMPRSPWPGWQPPRNPEETFYCFRLECSGVRAHVCCYRRIRKRRYKAREAAKEFLYPSCNLKCPQGALVRAAMPKGYDPALYQEAHRVKRPWRVKGIHGFMFPEALPYLPDFRFGDDALRDPETGYSRMGRGDVESGTRGRCPCCGHAAFFHRGAYGGECVIADCDCPGYGGHF